MNTLVKTSTIVHDRMRGAVFATQHKIEHEKFMLGWLKHKKLKFEWNNIKKVFPPPQLTENNIWIYILFFFDKPLKYSFALGILFNNIITYSHVFSHYF